MDRAIESAAAPLTSRPRTLEHMSEPAALAWRDVLSETPVLARTAQEIFESHPHHVIATTRRDGSPRVGGTNVFFTPDDVWIGAMPSALRNGDLRNRPRCAIHSAPLDEHVTVGDVRLDLVAREAIGEEAAALLGARDHAGEGVVFVLSVVAISLVRVEGDELVIETWDPRVGSRTTRHR